MSIIEILIVSLGLASDAFAVAICKGLSLKKITIKESLIVGLWFGFFQGFMPLIGYALGISFENIIILIDHWVALILLAYIGINMIIESFKNQKVDSSLTYKSMIILAIATSIDALAFGIAYVCAYGTKGYLLCFSIIGVITFITSCIGVKIGNKFGNRFEKLSKIIGGIILIIIGIKIFLEHLDLI